MSEKEKNEDPWREKELRPLKRKLKRLRRRYSKIFKEESRLEKKIDDIEYSIRKGLGMG